MKSLYLRIYLTLVALLLAFAFGSAWLFQRHIEQERGSVESAAGERLNAMAGLLKLALPPVTASREEQAAVFADWGQRLRMPLALEDAEGRRIATTQMFLRRADDAGAIIVNASLGDGRTLAMVRTVRPPVPPGGASVPGGPGGPGGAGAVPGAGPRPTRADEGPWAGPWLHRPVSPGAPAVSTLAVVLVLLFVGVAAAPTRSCAG